MSKMFIGPSDLSSNSSLKRKSCSDCEKSKECFFCEVSKYSISNPVIVVLGFERIANTFSTKKLKFGVRNKPPFFIERLDGL